MPKTVIHKLPLRGVDQDPSVNTRVISPEVMVSVKETDRDGYAIGSLIFAGISMHVECVAVTKDKDGVHQTVNEEMRSRIENLELEFDCAFSVTEFDHRTWVVFITPFGD